MPTLSIITVNLNNAAGLRKTIASVVSQTFSDYEYIIIDGGSTDGSVDVIREFAGKITCWVSEPDKGIFHAMNKGILRSGGEYLQFLNSGDWLVDDTILSKVFNKRHSADIVYGHINQVFKEGTRVHKALNEASLTMAYFYTDTIAHPSAFISRKLFDAGLYDESYSVSADKKFFIERVIIQDCSIQQIDECIVNFNTEGLSFSPEGHSKSIEENKRIFYETVPSRIVRDYEAIGSLAKSPLKKYIPVLTQAGPFQSLVVGIVSFLVKIYLFLKPDGAKSK